MRPFHPIVPLGSRRQADLFLEDLFGESDRRPRRQAAAPLPARFPVALPARPLAAPEPQAPTTPAPDNGLAEAVPLGGRGAFRHEPLGGRRGDNVEARWNVDAATPAGSTIDLVVYLHGYSTEPDDARFLAGKAASAGVDLVAAGGSVRVRASRPTLALVPRGRHSHGATWVFDRIADRAAFDQLVGAGLAWLCSTVLRLPPGSTLARGGLTLAAHSGGGAGLSALLASGVNPDEVACFDSIYGGEEHIRRWAFARIASGEGARSGLRVFYTGCSAPAAGYPAGRWVTNRNGRLVFQSPGSWAYRDGAWRLVTTEVYSRRLHEAMRRALAGVTGGAALGNRFRVQRTSVSHNDIPATYGPLLLEDIAADVPRSSTPPDAATRPACAANSDWLTRPPRKPGGDEPPPSRPEPGPGAAQEAEPRSAATNGRRADSASQRALRRLGLCPDGLRTLDAPGLAALRPIATAFGETGLVEMIGRLRYPPEQLARPPCSTPDLAGAFGRPVQRGAILAMRTLLAIPGHFRQLARQAAAEEEAYALENLGWLLVQALAGEVRSSSGVDFWLPAPPAFVTRFPEGVTGHSRDVTRLVTGYRLMDSSAEGSAAYRQRFAAWQAGAAGRAWRLDTGREASTSRPAAASFHPELFTIPPPVNITAERAEVRAAWARRLADFDAGRTDVPLERCDNAYLRRAGILAPIRLRRLQLQPFFPAPAAAQPLATLPGLAAVQPAFEGVFQAIEELGWNDLAFETAGLACFRGSITAGDPNAARTMSQHGMGTAVDLNVFENQQGTAGSMDPHLVALFEAFGFSWGKRLTPPDPMHFEYAPGAALTAA